VESCPNSDFYYTDEASVTEDVYNYCDFGYDTTAAKTYNESKCPKWYLRSESSE